MGLWRLFCSLTQSEIPHARGTFFLRISDFLFCFVLFFLMIAMDLLWFSRWELTCTINCIQNSYINLGQNTDNPTTENLHSGVLYFCNQIFLVVGRGWGKTPKIMKELLLHSS